MFAFLKRSFVLLIALLLIAVFIWIAGPYFAFGTYRPLETEYVRLIAILLVVACWAMWRLVKWLRTTRASAALASAMVRPPPKEKEQPSAEVAKLRERFEEAVAALAPRGKTRHNLYDLPWYAFIGAPGSGKTTALLNSGLKFPLEQRSGKAAIRGVGGTRNCDWWFTDEAVFLDTAGRYTTQDSDPASDSEAWKEFLALLGKYRKRRPLNGVVLTISAQDLITLGESGREAYVEAARRRLTEFTRELRIQLPVYVMVTKCDMVAGFSEYFDDLAQDGRKQVWGVTFPYEQTLSREAPAAFPAEFDALMERLNARLFARLEAERGARRRAAVFGFPQQMAALRDPLTQFVADVFSATQVDAQILLRGVYLTSGTQDGTQIDRLLGAVGRRFGIAPESVAPPPGRGKAYFVERLLKDVVIAESGLAGTNRRLELTKAAWQFGAYVGIALVTAISLVALWVSYGNNTTYLRQVEADVAILRRVPVPTAAASAEEVLPRLNAVRAVSDSANRHRGNTPWGMRWGLYQGSIGKHASDAYRRELNGLLRPRFAARLKQHLVDYEAEPGNLYVYLKAYLMLVEPRRLDPKLLQDLADLEWPATASASGAGASLSSHVRNLLAYREALSDTPEDRPSVERARRTIRPDMIPQIMYEQVKRAYSDDARALRLDVNVGGIEQVLSRKSGRRLSEPIPGLYRKEVFNEVTGDLVMGKLALQYANEDWVLGPGRPPVPVGLKLKAQVTEVYEQDYIWHWTELLQDLEIVPFPTVEKYRTALEIIVAPTTSPLKNILKTVVDNTNFVKPPAEAAAPSTLDKMKDGLAGLANTARKSLGTPSADAGTRIAAAFQPIHQLMSGAPTSPFDGVLVHIRNIQERLDRIGSEAGGQSPLRTLADPQFLELQGTLRREAAILPVPVNVLVGQIVQNVGAAVGSDATTLLRTKYQSLVERCRGIIRERYPFGAKGEMSLLDFSGVFGPGGEFDTFYTAELEPLVDTSQSSWQWRPGAVDPSTLRLDQFQLAARIRRMFFTEGSKTPQVDFTVTLSDLDSEAVRFYLQIDGNTFDLRPNQRTPPTPAVWPGPKPGLAWATIQDTAQSAVTVGRETGPWAWFHLIDAKERNPGTGVLRFESEFHSAQVRVEAPNAGTNPLISREWRKFTCGP